MSLPHSSLTPVILATSLALSSAEQNNDSDISWSDLNKANLPKAISYQEITRARYEYLGFQESEIKEILSRKNEMIRSQTDWPKINLDSPNYEIQYQDLGDITLGKHTWPADQIILAKRMLEPENQHQIGQILSEELLHASQETSEDIQSLIFVGKNDQKLAERLNHSSAELEEISKKLEKIDPKLNHLKFKELAGESTNLLGKSFKCSEEATELIFEFVLKSEDDIPLQDLPIFGVSSQIKFIKKYHPPKDLIEKLEVLEQNEEKFKESHNLISKKLRILADIYRLALSNYYYQFKVEIDPRLSDIGFAWMLNQKQAGEKVAPIMTEETAEEAINWFMKQKFTPGSIFDIRQKSLELLFEQFDDQGKEKIKDELTRRMPALANKQGSKNDALAS